MEIALGIIIGSVLVGGLAVFLFRPKPVADTKDLEGLFSRVSQDVLKQTQEQFLVLAQEKLKNQQDSTQKDLSHAKDIISGLITEIRKDITTSSEKLLKSEEARIATFSSLTKEIEMQKSVTSELRASTEDLKRVLSNNQMRGAFGEQVAENLLRMAGFVVGQDYTVNREQDHVDTRPDFTIFLPDKTRINIDVKFPYTALLRATSTEDKQEKEQHLKTFAADVRHKIKQVTSRDYINPEERTVDFVILFIPNEMIFSFIYDQLNDVWEEGMQKKVIMAGPFSFTALLRMIKQAYTNFRYQENLHHVIGLIQKFEIEYDKYSGALDTLGDRLQSASKQYEAVSGVRSRSLNKILDQIKNQQLIGSGKDSNGAE